MASSSGYRRFVIFQATLQQSPDVDARTEDRRVPNLSSGRLHRQGDPFGLVQRIHRTQHRLLPTVSLGCGHAKRIDLCTATIRSASLEYAGMSSVSRWAASVQSISSDQGTETDTCFCRNVVPGCFGLEASARDPEFTFEQGYQADNLAKYAISQCCPWYSAWMPDLFTVTHFLHIESLRDNNLYALSLPLQAAPATKLKLRWHSLVRCCREMNSRRVALSVAMDCASIDFAPPLCSRAQLETFWRKVHLVLAQRRIFERGGTAATIWCTRFDASSICQSSALWLDACRTKKKTTTQARGRPPPEGKEARCS